MTIFGHLKPLTATFGDHLHTRGDSRARRCFSIKSYDDVAHAGKKAFSNALVAAMKKKNMKKKKCGLESDFFLRLTTKTDERTKIIEVYKTARRETERESTLVLKLMRDAIALTRYCGSSTTKSFSCE